MLAKEIKRGTIVNHGGAPCLIETVSVQSPSARGAATLYKFRARDLLSKQKVDIVLKGSDSLDEANFEKRSVKFMYADGTHLHFLDQQDFNQLSLPREDLEDEARWLTDALEGVQALVHNDQCVGVAVPATVALRIVECEPYARGNSATGRMKPGTLETGTIVQVPEYLSEGEVIKVDTRTGEFLSRA